MAETLQELAADAVTGETGSSTHTTQIRKRKRAAVVKKPRNGGRDVLWREADRMVGLKAERIAKVISDRASHGDLASVRLLVELADRRKARAEPKEKRTGPTWAQELEMEEEWVGPMDEIGKSGWGGVERENG